MKAKELLRWIVCNDVCTDSMGMIEVDEEFDFQAYFGYEPVSQVPAGEYLFFYTDTVSDVDLKLLQRVGVPNGDLVCIVTDNEDRKNGGVTMIYLIRIDKED